MEAELIEASRKGCVTTLNTLIEKDPLILNEFWLTSSGQTPLHICASRGHLHFAEALLERKPKLAMELDSRKRLPLHLACIEGHAEIVKALLGAYKNAIFDRDQYGRVPIYYAVMGAQVSAVREFISTAGVGVLKLDGGESSVLHLCFELNQFQLLKVLVDDYVRDNEELLNLKDGESGNTILHLAVMRKKFETLEYLLSIPKVKARAVVNGKGFTALKILERWPEDKKSRRIQNILEQKQEAEKPAASLQLCCKKIKAWLANHLRHQGNWVEEIRGSLMVVATVTTTMTFQPSISPPGGVSGDDCNDKNECEPGTSVLAKNWSSDYFEFVVFNTIAFIASISVVFLLISGFPLKNKFIMWILTLAMFTSLTFTALAYLYSMRMVFPSINNYRTWVGILNFISVVLYIWIGLVALILGIHSIRLLTVLVSKLVPKQHKICGCLKTGITSSTNRDEPIEDGKV